jgi:hypothetical protein
MRVRIIGCSVGSIDEEVQAWLAKRLANRGTDGESRAPDGAYDKPGDL